MNETTYILSLDASQFEVSDNKYSIQMPEIKSYTDFSKHYKGSIGTSLDLLHLKQIDNKVINTITLNKRRKSEVKKYVCDAIINVSFSKPKFNETDKKSYRIKISNKGSELISQNKSYQGIMINERKLRTDFYTEGFTIVNKNGNEAHYVHYKRSSSKSKTGNCLFIRDIYYNDMIKWSHLNLDDPKGKIDLAALKSYESLTCSCIEDTIFVEPKSILFVDDFISPEFEAYQSVTKSETTHKTYESNGKTRTREVKKLVCNNEWVKVQNICTDGECLLDESYFPEKYGFKLLRQRFFKSAALNTKLVQFYKNYFKDEYETAVVKDRFGRKINVKDIRMVVCPSSLKILKFAETWNMTEKEIYEHWLTQLTTDKNVFGVVKHEKPSPFGFNVNQLSYQIINTLPVSRDEVKAILKYEFDYIKRLKDDKDFFIKHISSDEEQDNVYSSHKFIQAMINICPDFYRTQLFKDFRHDKIKNYKDNLCNGKVKVQCDYAVQFGNVWELLLSTVKEVTEKDFLHLGRECYCKRFTNGGLAIFRSPHIASGNILYSENVYHKEFDWFNLTHNVVLVNCINNDWQDRTQGSDMDSDALLLVNQPLIVSKAKECDVISKKGEECKCLYPTPVNKVEGDKTLREYSYKNMADIDYIISGNMIGRVVNVSQLLNSYYWDIKYNNPTEKALLQEIYKNISICSTLSQIEIDKSKKMFKNLSVKSILSDMCKMKGLNGQCLMEISQKRLDKNKLSEDEYNIIKKMQIEHNIHFKETTSSKGNTYLKISNAVIKTLEQEKKDLRYRKVSRYIDGKCEEVDVIDKLVKPMFYKDCSKDMNCDFRYFNTPMDFLEDILSKEFPKTTIPIKTIDIMDLIIVDKSKINDGQVKDICMLVNDYKAKCNATYIEYGNISNNEDKQDARQQKLSTLKEEVVSKLKDLIIHPATLHYIIAKMFTDKKDKVCNFPLTLMSLMYDSKPELMKQMFTKEEAKKEA